MQQFFAYDYDGPAFELFGTGHLVSLTIVAAILAFLLWGWREPSEAGKRRARRLIIGTILVIEAAWHGWNLVYGSWTIQYHLPLHACSLSIWGMVYILLTRDYRVFEVLFFIGLAGASQTLLTPEAGGYGLPHFRAVQTLASHGIIVIAAVYLASIEGMRPTWASIWKTMLFANLYMLFITGVNQLLGSNYMYTLRKPESASVLDLMGPWPWYLLAAEFFALFLFVVIYLPFAVSDWRAVRGAPASSD